MVIFVLDHLLIFYFLYLLHNVLGKESQVFALFVNIFTGFSPYFSNKLALQILIIILFLRSRHRDCSVNGW